MGKGHLMFNYRSGLVSNIKFVKGKGELHDSGGTAR
ncbi:hypothetical protein SAMN05421832_12329 [Psychrobacillus psychrodurans]|nr:hypothetical protein SAMN05421832_12329 [Psychrobacillus psychrodurans]